MQARARAGGRWSTANPNGTMFTPEQRGAVDGDGDGDGDGGPPGIDQFTDDHAFNAQNSTMVWGTTISLHESMTNAKQFLRENQAMALEIEDKIRASHGLEFDVGKPGDDEDILEA